MKRCGNLFLRVSPRAETELDRDGVFLRCAFEREKKFGAPKGRPPHECSSREPGEGGLAQRERRQRLGATSLFSLAISDRLRDGSPRHLLCPPPPRHRRSSFSRSVASHACIRCNCARDRAMNERHGVARRAVTRYGVTRADVHASMLRPVHDEWSQDEGTGGGGRRQRRRRNRKGMHETQARNGIAVRGSREAALCETQCVRIYSRVLQY